LRQRVVVVGAGMAGLHLALALGQRRNYRVIVLERDLPPKNGKAASAFDSWKRRGVAHFRQSHIFHPRLLDLYRSRYPSLLDQLLRAGARELTIQEALPTRLLPQYVASARDDDCALLLTRRATLESVIRAHVANLPTVEIVSSTNVCDVVLIDAPDRPRLIGVKIASGETKKEIDGDVIVDAAGRFTRFPRWLREKGVQAREEASFEVATVYHTRYYRLREGMIEPREFGRPVFGHRDYLSCCVYPADDRYFSVTMTCAARDVDLQQQFADPERFHVACMSLAEIAPWVNAERAEPVTDVLAMARFHNHWRSYVHANQPLLHGFFAIGDALAHTNPAYGAGCSWAARHAHILADVLETSAEPAVRAILFDRRVRAEAYPFYSWMAAKDKAMMPERGASASSALRLLLEPVRAIAKRAAEVDIGIFLWALRRKYMVDADKSWSDYLFLLRRLSLVVVRGGWYERGGCSRQVLSRSEFLSTVFRDAARPHR
jgi:2-polyprenyl-6-methoxyphenol hydroxylase-like FAD-dependent oxidoreductase